MSQKDNPKIILAGAGPGDPELISLKALKAIKTADVILYDALVNHDLLKHERHVRAAQEPVALRRKKCARGKQRNHRADSAE